MSAIILLRYRRCALGALLLAPCAIVHAQLPDDAPECRRDARLGIICAGNPPVVVEREHPIRVLLSGSSGSASGYAAGAHYEHEFRGADHLANATLILGRATGGGETRTVGSAELLATIGVGRSHRPYVGLLSRSHFEISHPFTLAAGVRYGRALRYMTAGIEVGQIRNRGNDDSGFETSLSLGVYRSLRYFELDGSARAGMGWNAGGRFAEASLGITRRFGSQVKLRGDWGRDHLSASRKGPSASGIRLRIMLSTAPPGLVQ